jgi:hypothetical protein
MEPRHAARRGFDPWDPPRHLKTPVVEWSWGKSPNKKRAFLQSSLYHLADIFVVMYNELTKS